VSFSGDESGFYPKGNLGIRLKDKGQVVMMAYSKYRDVHKDFSGELMLQFNLGKGEK